MKDILSEIVEHKRIEVGLREAAMPLEELRERLAGQSLPCRSLSEALRSSRTGIIAEFKRKSPSKGWIHEDVGPEDVVPGYAEAGAAALSILTDSEYFGGSLDYLRQMRPLVGVPILCKDFFVSEYQVYEARLAGADTILLIAACLSKEECMRLGGLARSLGMETLLELHSEEELAYMDCGSEVYGINNRHLGSFVTEVSHSFMMAEKIGLGNMPGAIWVSESGISSPETVIELRKAGFRGFLMGENFMKRPDPAAALKEFIANIEQQG